VGAVKVTGRHLADRQDDSAAQDAPCDTRAGGDAIMLSCGNEFARRGDAQKKEGVKLRSAEHIFFANNDNPSHVPTTISMA
jgi:hypothetical protein